MRIPSASELLIFWESGLALTPVARGLRLLAALFPEASDEELAHYTIGERDVSLLTLREQLFGAEVASVATCPRCGEALELNFSIPEVRALTGSPSAMRGVVTMHVEGYTIRCRPPTSADLLAVAGMASAEKAQQALLQRCILAIDLDETAEAPLTSDQLPPSVTAAIVEQMAQADPLADVRLALVCPACSHQWSAQFDILEFLWIELTDWVQRALREVHLLAVAYGWREADILAMSAWRRQSYLRLIGE